MGQGCPREKQKGHKSPWVGKPMAMLSYWGKE